MRLLLDMEHDFPGGEYPDVDYIVAKLRVEGSFLDVEEVVTLRRALAAIGGIVSFIISREERYPASMPARGALRPFRRSLAAHRRHSRPLRPGEGTTPRPPCRRSAAPSANAKGRRPSGCRPCCLRPRGRASSMPTPRSRSATARP